MRLVQGTIPQADDAICLKAMLASKACFGAAAYSNRLTHPVHPPK